MCECWLHVWSVGVGLIVTKVWCESETKAYRERYGKRVRNREIWRQSVEDGVS